MKRFVGLIFGLSLLCNSVITGYAQQEITIYSDYYYMIDMANKQIILDQGSEEMIYPASMTKMMALIVSLEKITDTSDRVVLDQEIFAGLLQANASLAGFSLNESVTIEDCLYGLFLPSGAETTRAVARYVAGSETAFVELMNAKAVELGMQNTHYVNTTGLHNNEHKTTLRDLAILLEYCLQNPKFEAIFSTNRYLAQSGSMHKNGLSWQSSTFRLVETIGFDQMSEIVLLGGKTGYTIPAGLCLASIAEKEGRQYMLITAHAPAGSTPYHAMDAVGIYNMVFNDYQKTTIIEPDQVLGSASIQFNFSNRKIHFQVSEPVQLTLPSQLNIETLEYQLDVAEVYDAPLEEGQKLGTVTVLLEGKEVYTTTLLATKTIGRNPLLYGFYHLQIWIMNNLILTGILLFGIGFLVWRFFLQRREIQRAVQRKLRRKPKRYRI